ncbi:hypothetical protein KP509_20G040500 [Ceratopteris richardii]|uniref:SET domain-containing protein n=1 Tax=Ceratopteris richardii TaxID=49495 RepID=A0A8T2SHZ2_CERRI|nr:hypothetical protein KP509_20G040500 [Ceratopteris richardii]
MASSSSMLTPPAAVTVCSSSKSKGKTLEQQGVSGWGCDTYTPESARVFQEWLTSRRLPPQKLVLQPVKSGGRGLVSKANIRRGEKLLYVPFSLVITSDSEWSNPECGSYLSAAGVPDWPFLATYLISEACQGTNSPWHSYISALPRQPESILLWSESEVNKYLFASSVYGQALERISEVQKTFDSMDSSIYRKHSDLFPRKFFNIQSFKWAFGILFSRLVRLQSLNEQVALVPWADMLNHSSEVKACLDYEEKSNTIILTTDQAYQPSEQVFISYGEKSKGEILLSYGFVSVDTHPGDSLNVSLSLSPNDEMLEAKQAVLHEYGLSTPCKYPVTISGIPSQLFAFAYLAASPSTLQSYYSEMAAVAASKGGLKLDGFRPFAFDVPLDVDIQAYQTVLDTIEAALRKVSKYLEDKGKDNIVMSNESDAKNAKLRMASILCTSEQRILQRAQYIIRTKLRELLARKTSSGDGKSSLLYGLRKLFN